MSETQAAKHFDQIADDYDASIPTHVRDHYLRRRAAVIGPLLAGGEGLDVGCGTGVLMEALKPFGKLIGADASEGMLQVLRQKGRGEGVCAPSDALPFADGRFNVVFSVAVLHHVAAPEAVRKTIGEMVRVAKNPGGRIVIWDHNPRNPYWPILMRRVPQDTGEERLIPADEIITALSSAGAKNIRLMRGGFIPDFMPKLLMPLAAFGEFVLEKIPFVRSFAAHNIVIAET